MTDQNIKTPPIINPFQSKIIERFEALPAIAKDDLSLNAIRKRFLSPPLWTPELLREDVSSSRPIDASVLIALFASQGQAHELEVLFTKRSASLKHHAGQISFPGGKRHDKDLDLVATAMREAREEAEIEVEEVLGNLPSYHTISGFKVIPVVALCKSYGKADRREVDEIFCVPLSYLMDARNHELRMTHAGGVERKFFSIPWQQHLIWGATAAILRNLYQMLRATYVID